MITTAKRRISRLEQRRALRDMKFTERHILFGENKYDRKLVDKIIAAATDGSIKHIVIDSFCGLGGVTCGFEQIPGYMVIACINHWPVAIKTHQRNYPNCLHLLEDFRTADLHILQYMIHRIKDICPWIIVHGWFSMECTNFSLAKGGMPRDADSRTLADHMDRYVAALDMDYMWVENVKEFMLWGPMIPKVQVIKNGKKIKVVVPQGVNDIEYYTALIEEGNILSCPLNIEKKKKKSDPNQVRRVGPWMVPDPYLVSTDFNRWKREIQDFGYNLEHRLMNCADYGVPQHRVRLIMQFSKDDLPIKWPKPSHDKNGRNGLPKWLPVKDCLDLDDEGQSILSFKMVKGKLTPRIESEDTIDRVIKGCMKHVLRDREMNFFQQAYSGDSNSKIPGVLQPSRAITGSGGNLFLTKVHMIDHYFGNGYTKPVDQPAGTSGTKDGISLQTIQFLTTYFSCGDGSSINEKSPAIATKDKYPLVTTHFMDMQYGQGQQNKSIYESSGAVLQNPKQKLVEVTRFVKDTKCQNLGSGLEHDERIQAASCKHFYLVNFQWFNDSFKSMNEPANTIIARMDKSPNYLVTLETGEVAIEVFDYDPPHYIRLKKFMAENGIVAINMRMLNDIELLKIMTLPAEMQLTTSSTANKKMIGNAVPPKLVYDLGSVYLSDNVNAA